MTTLLLPPFLYRCGTPAGAAAGTAVPGAVGVGAGAAAAGANRPCACVISFLSASSIAREVILPMSVDVYEPPSAPIPEFVSKLPPKIER